MKKVEQDGGVVLEMSREEFEDIAAIIYTANISWGSLDEVPYNLTEERLTRCVKALDAINLAKGKR